VADDIDGREAWLPAFNRQGRHSEPDPEGKPAAGGVIISALLFDWIPEAMRD